MNARVLSLVFLIGWATHSFAARPNIVFIVADDLGYADLGVQGGKDVRTPNIDALAKSGLQFTNAYASGCVCSPSRVGLLTGRYQNRSGHDSNPHRQFGLDAGEVTLAERLKKAGYVTGLVGKWHLGDSAEQHPLARGFDEFYGILEHGIGPEGKGNRAIVVYRDRTPAPTPADHTTAFGEEAVAFVERHQGEPFFLYVPFTAVHSPHVAPEKYEQEFAHIADRRRRRYLAMLATLDDMVGRLLTRLRDLKLEQNTLVFFMADNGGPEGAPENGVLRGGKWSLWEGGIRSPLFVSWSGRISPGTSCGEPVCQIDLAPTALAAAGVQAEAADGQARAKPLDGLSLLPLLEGQTRSLDRQALFWRFGVQFAVRAGDWKLVKPSLADEPMLFHLAADPGESQDQAAAQSQRVKELHALWTEWNAGNIPPRWEDARWNGAEARKERKRAKKAGKT